MKDRSPKPIVALLAAASMVFDAGCGEQVNQPGTATGNPSLVVQSPEANLSRPLIPQALLTACNAGLLMGQSFRCFPLARVVESKRSDLDAQCAESNLIGVKSSHLDDLLLLEQYIQSFDFESMDDERIKALDLDSRAVTSICAGALDPTVTFVNIEPDPIQIGSGETVDVMAFIACSNTRCEGDLTWVMAQPPAGTVATVTETFVDAAGNEHADVTGVRADVTSLHVFVDDFKLSGDPWVQGMASVEVSDACPLPPVIPDCSGRGNPSETLQAFGCIQDGGTISIPTDPTEEVFAQFSFSGCCSQCGCVGAEGTGARWRIVDENGAQLNFDLFGGLQSHTDDLWDRGNAGSCGNPNAIEIEPLTGGSKGCWAVSAVKHPRQVNGADGWNQAGTSFLSAPALKPNATTSWCGNLNETPCGGGSGGGLNNECRATDPVCTTDHTWLVGLEQGDQLQIAIRLKARPTPGANVDLNLHDQFGQFVLNIKQWHVDALTEDAVVYTHQGSTGFYHLALNSRGTDPSKQGGDLWEYGMGITVRKSSCVAPTP